MKKLFSLFYILFVFQFSNAQTISYSLDSIDQAIKETVKEDSPNKFKDEEAIDKLRKIYTLSKKIHYKEGILESGKWIMIFYYHKGQYETIIKFASNLEKEVDLKKSVNFSCVSKFHKLLALSYIKLGFVEKGSKEYKKSIKYAKKIKDKEDLHYSLALIYKDLADHFDQTNKYSDSIRYYLIKSLNEIELIKNKDKILKLDGKLIIYNSVAIYYLRVSQPRDTVLARKYFLKAEEIYENFSPPIRTVHEIEFLINLSNFYFIEKNYNKAIEIAKKALIIERINPTNSYQKKKIYEILTKSYLETGDKKQSMLYMNFFTQINDSMNFEEKNSLKTPINKIIEDNAKANSKQTQKISGIIVTILILTFITIYIKVRKNQKKIHENYKRLIQKLKEDKETLLQEKPDNISSKEDIIKKTSTKISDETVNQLIVKLDKFEQSNDFLKKDLTLTSLAHNLNTNPKYLSEIIKENKSKSFNNYINSLRINYITHKLYEVSVYSQYKIKYLSEECGYASPQVFVIAFKKENGVTPSYFIEQLKKDHKTSELV